MEKDTPATIWLRSRLALAIDVRPSSCGAVTKPLAVRSLCQKCYGRLAGAEDDRRQVEAPAPEIAIVELRDLEADALGEVPDLVELDAVTRYRHAGKQHRLGARAAEIGGDCSEARLEVRVRWPDFLVLVQGLTAFTRRRGAGLFLLTGARMSKGRLFSCCEGVRA